MADTTSNKEQIREVIHQLSQEYNTVFNQEPVVMDNLEGLKYDGASKEKGICINVCTNKLSDGKIKAGQRSSVFEKCYLLLISDKYKEKWLVFTDKDFKSMFIQKYGDYFKGISIK